MKQNVRYATLMAVVAGALALLAAVTGALAAPQAPDAPLPPPDVGALPDSVRFAAPQLLREVAAPQLPPPAAPVPLPDPVWRVGVVTDGLYALDYAALTAAGVPLSGATSTDLHLLWRGQELAVDLFDGGDGTFDPGDRLLFYGESFHGSRQAEKYTGENVYWLTVDAAAPAEKMVLRAARLIDPVEPSAPCAATARAEKNLKYWARESQTPGTVTTWFWEAVNRTTSITRTYTLELDAPVTTGYTATLVVELASRNSGAANPDHHVRLSLNGHELGDFYWEGITGHVITTEVRADWLADGANPLAVAYLADVGPQNVYFDRATLNYVQEPVVPGGRFTCRVPAGGTHDYLVTAEAGSTLSGTLLYDVTEPLTPVRLTAYTSGTDRIAFRDTISAGTRYLAAAPRPAELARYYPADLISPTAGADEIVIAPRAFLDALQPLLDHRAAQGLRVRAVAVEDIYPLFNGGIFHPEAIRAFAAHAYANWPAPAPRYLFLVGDGNFNFKGYNPDLYGEFTPSHIPPYLEFADPTQGEVPVDARFGDVDGDGMPELRVGRLPAQNTAEVAAYVDKLVAYETAPPAAWQSRAILAADDGHTSYEGFDLILNRLEEDFLAGEMHAEKVYVADYCSGPGRPSLDPCPTMTQALTETWNAGAALLTYAGHGSIHRWGHEKFLLNTEMMTALTNAEALPFMLSLDCWDGYWMFPPEYPAQDAKDVRSIGEWATTVLTDAGAIAAFGPAGLGFAYEEEQLTRAMYAALFEEGIFDVGALTQRGREAIPSSYMARTYTLLGDPALRLRVDIQDTVGLAVRPSPLTVTQGSSVQLYAHPLDQWGNLMPALPTATWTTTLGTIDATGRFTAPDVAAEGWITATATLVSGTVEIRPSAGTAVYVVAANKVYLPLILR